ncbi:Cathepsin G [Trichinella zimbabwensis]|uniref:Cathepsin G n=1 Tax=Trichinella zimbabwensis TaxID=268475 RepID=A0A0V1HKU9_9BILA|nr:Cathepsin G [Trichinella zimbabwensis]
MPGCAYNIRSHSCDIQHIEEQYHRSSMILPLAASQRLAIMMTGNNATCEKMMRFAFLVYFMTVLKLASTQIRCGMPVYPIRESDDNSNRIIGGWEARPHSLPWQLYVLLGYEAGLAACGGTIIQLNPGNSTNLALTSAHCMGDSGGPLFCKMDNVYVQYGIVAVRARGYPPGSISIYTRLSTYINWLKISAWKYDRD